MLINTNIASTKPTKRTKDVNKAEDKALAYIKKIVIGMYTIKNIYTKENTRKAKKIKNSNRKSVIFVIN
jgi:hypothetical protein